MIKLTEEISLDSDAYQWILCDSRGGRKKPHKTYHGTLPQVARYVLDNGIKGADTLLDLSNRLENLSETILSNVGERND